MRNKMIIFGVVISILLIASIICLNNTIRNSETVIISINSERIELNKNVKTDSINLSTFNSEKDTIVKYESGNAKIKVNGQQLRKNTDLNLGILEISNNSKIEVEVSYKFWDNIKYVVNTMNADFPNYSVEGESEYEGDYYMSTYSFDYNTNNFIFKLDKTGKIKYYKKINKVAFDFKKELTPDKNIRYMYLEAIDDNFEGLTSLLPCNLVIMDEDYNEIERINYLLKNGETIPLENHAYIYLGENHYILTTYKAIEKEEKINSKLQKVYVMDNYIQEIKDGEIIWEFNTTKYPEFYKYSSLDKLNYTKPYQDYVHINSMEIDKGDGNLICSYRNIDAVIKIDRKTGELIWILGGVGDEFGLTDKQKFSKQHSAISIGNNTIMLYDNGNANKKSRVLKFKVDEKKKKVKEYKEYDTGVYAFMMGSVRVMNEQEETYLVCYGGGNYSKYSVEEINYKENEVKFKFTFLDSRLMYNANKIN